LSIPWIGAGRQYSGCNANLAIQRQPVQHQLDEALFDRFNQQLDQQGYQAKKGQIVDASFVDVPKQRNNRAENAQIKVGEIPERFQENAHVKVQKDTDARWTKKNQETTLVTKTMY
jgi:IS5 family transposase